MLENIAAILKNLPLVHSNDRKSGPVRPILKMGGYNFTKRAHVFWAQWLHVFCIVPQFCGKNRLEYLTTNK